MDTIARAEVALPKVAASAPDTQAASLPRNSAMSSADKLRMEK